MRSAIGSALCLALAACSEPAAPEPAAKSPVSDTPGEPPAKPEAPELASPPIGARVLIDQQQIWSGPSRDSGAIAVPPEPRLRIAEVVAVSGEFIELRSVAATADAVCGASTGFDSEFELRFFVEAKALQPVLAKPKLVEFDDGTKLEFAAGAPVIESTSEVRVGDATFKVALEPDDVGRWFSPASPPSLPTSTTSSRSLTDPLHYGESSFTSQTDPFVRVHERKAVEGGALLTFEGACGRFTLRSRNPFQMARSGEPDLSGVLGMIDQQGLVAVEGVARLFCKPVVWVAAAGTQLTWADGGQPAGVSLREVELSNAVEADGRVCFYRSELQVCIESSALTRTDTDCDGPLDPPAATTRG